MGLEGGRHPSSCDQILLSLRYVTPPGANYAVSPRLPCESRTLPTTVEADMVDLQATWEGVAGGQVDPLEGEGGRR